MRFYIASDSFFKREEEDGILSVFGSTTHDTLYFNNTSKKLLEYCDRWVDLKDFVSDVNFTGVSKEKVYSDFSRVLLKLEANELAKLDNVEIEPINGIKKADLKDIRALSLFVDENKEKFLGHAYVKGTNNYEYKQMYRKKSKNAYDYIIAADNKVYAMIEVSHTEANRFGEALMLNTMLFDKGFDEERCITTAKKMLDFIKNEFSTTYYRLRYLMINESDKDFIDFICKLGFEKKARFEAELRDGRDLTLYDYSFI